MRRWVPVLGVLIGLGTAAGLFVSRSESTDDPKLFSNRIWADRMPKDERDRVLYFVPREAGSKRGGVVQRASRFAFAGELFSWSRDKTKLSLEFPQDRKKSSVTVRTWSCTNEAPKGFELCLELSDGKAKRRMYSRKDWRLPEGEGLPISVGEILNPSETSLSDTSCADCAEVGLEALAPR